MSIMANFINKVIVGIMTAYTAFCFSFSSAATPNYTQEDINLLAEVMYHENWNTDSEHLAAYYTGAVVMNRVKSKEWPNTIKEVLYQKGQYSTTKKFFTKEIPAECYELAEMILRDGTPDVPENVIFQSMRKLGNGTWKKVNTDYFCYG
jgi:hypothetical protein